jgi:hypothetical protein
MLLEIEFSGGSCYWMLNSQVVNMVNMIWILTSQVVQKPTQEAKQTLAALSRQVATSVQDIVHCAELIKGR